MSNHADQPVIPRGVLLGAAALLGLALLSAGAGRITGIGTLHLPPADAGESRDLRFEDRADGAVVIYDARAQRAIEVLAPGTNGFIRGVMRGLARERMLRGIGAERPFRLVRDNDNRLLLSDPATGRLIGLDAFGITNAEAFARLLADKDRT
ncbi:MAG: phosphonate-binding protein [Rhodospirillales bacterium]|nr:phosphonate-binding protein [Rhodospirillales bacterium]